MPLFLIPIVAGAATYGALTQERAGEYSAGGGGRQIDAHQIYQQITTGLGTKALSPGQQAANRLQQVFQERIGQIEALSRKMDDAWQGDSADAANAGAHPLKAWLEDSQPKLAESDRYLSDQMSAFDTVRSKVQPVPQQPPESDFLNDITPWETDTDRAIKDYNAKAQVNVDAFSEYYQVSSSNAQRMPTYTALDGEIGDVDVDKNGSGDDSRKPGRDNGTGDGSRKPGGDNGTGDGSRKPGGDNGFNDSFRKPGGDNGFNDSFRKPGGGGENYGTMPGSVAGGYGRGEWDDSTNASSYAPSKSSTSDFTSGRPFVPGTPSFGGGPGSGPGGGGGISGIGGVGAFGAGGAAGAGFGPGAGTGSSTGAAGPNTGMGRAAMGGVGTGASGAAGAGRGAMPMGAMGGAGQGQGSEDEEHQTKYLIQEDGDSLFGSDELTAPPVIGE